MQWIQVLSLLFISTIDCRWRKQVLEIEKERLRVCSYLNFKEKYENNANVKTSLVPAKSFVEALEGPGIELIMLRLKEIAQMLPQATGIASTVK